MTGTEELRGVSLAGEGRGSRLRTLGKRAAGEQTGLGCEEGGPSGLGGPLLPEGVDLSWEAPGDRPGPAAMREEPFPQQDQVSGTQARPPNRPPPPPPVSVPFSIPFWPLAFSPIFSRTAVRPGSQDHCLTS